jgi:ariadne-1
MMNGLLDSAKQWLADPQLNLLKFHLSSSNNTELSLEIPSLAASFTISLAQPHGINSDSAVLEEFEADSFQFCFADSERSIPEILDYATKFLQGEAKLWANASSAKSPNSKKISTENTENDDKSQEPAAQEDNFNDSGDEAWGEDFQEEDPSGIGLDPMISRAGEGKDNDSKRAGPSFNRQRSYQILNREELAKIQQSLIDRVSSQLNLTASATIILLKHCKWNETEMIKRWKADGNKLAMETNCTAILHTVLSPPEEGSSELDCQVCFDSFPADKTFAINCGHRFCTDCYRDYLISEIESGATQGGTCLSTRCPGFKCTQLVGQETFELLLEDSYMEKYKNVLLLSFVDDSEVLAWCPAAGCSHIVAYSQRQKTVQCVCGFRFCFQCKIAAHAPAKCKDSQAWLARDKGSENLDSKYILDNTKACPKCGVRTKKEGGCMYITCSKCQNPWCWQCGKGDHHVWECNRPAFDSSASSDKDDLNRYLFYFERYFNHNESLKFCEKQLTQTQNKMSELVNEGMHFKRVEFLMNAVQLVIQCRRVLKW